MSIMEAAILSLSLFIGIINGVPIGSTENIFPCGNATCHGVKINGYSFPGSHDDIGIYYQIQHIISSVGSASRQNHNRRFIQAATSIFSTWWNEQDELIKSQMRQLINEGRLEIVNGSLSMNDEGAVHYQPSINQYTLGLRFIEDTLEKYAGLTVSWQIDAFGRSRTQASLTSQISMGAVFFARLDYRNKRQKEKSQDMIWTRSDNLGRATATNTAIAIAKATGTPVTVTKTATDPGAGAATATATALGTSTASSTATSTGTGASTATTTSSGTTTATAIATSSATGATTAAATASGTAPATARATSRGTAASTATATGSTTASATAIATATATVAATAVATATDHDVIDEITT